MHNPAAGSNRRGKFAFELARAINDARTNGALNMENPIKMLETCADRPTRIASLADAFSASGRDGLNYVLVVGGDGTFADAITAAAKSSTTHDSDTDEGRNRQRLRKNIRGPIRSQTDNRFHKRLEKILPLDVAGGIDQRRNAGKLPGPHLDRRGIRTPVCKMERGRDSRTGPFKNLLYLPGFLERYSIKFFNVQLKNDDLPAIGTRGAGMHKFGWSLKRTSSARRVRAGSPRCQPIGI